MTRRRFYGKWLLDRRRFSSPWVGRSVCVRTDGKMSPAEPALSLSNGDG
jgi:hypothetical protein